MSFRLCWVTDPHLNFAREWREWWQRLVAEGHDYYILTGDIAEAASVASILEEMTAMVGNTRTIFFVLGNHDYYGGSISQVRESVGELTDRHPGGLHFLTTDGSQELSRHGDYESKVTTAIVGTDGWYDGRNGDLQRSGVLLNDFFLIEEFRRYDLAGRGRKAMKEIAEKMRDLADADAASLRRDIRGTLNLNLGLRRLFVATHVPPFAGAARHEGHPSDADYLPFFSNRCVGEAILEETVGFRQAGGLVTVLCGHTHSAGRICPAEGLEVLTGAAVYGDPQKCGEFEFD